MKKHFLLPIVALGLVGLVSCNVPPTDSVQSTKTSVTRMRTVTFDYNYSGAPAETSH